MHPTSLHTRIIWPKKHIVHYPPLWDKDTIAYKYTCWRLILYLDVSRFSWEGSGPGGVRCGLVQGAKREQGAFEAEFWWQARVVCLVSFSV